MSKSSSDVALPEGLLHGAAHVDRESPQLEETVDLFGRLSRPLLRYLFTFGITASDGEEIVQETFLALFKHLNCGKPRGNLPSWIFRVGHNLALKHLERARSRRSMVQEQFDLETIAHDASLNPEEQLALAQRRQKLQSVLWALPERDRYCICLRAEGLRYREIGEILGMSLGAVAISLARSLARFERADQE